MGELAARLGSAVIFDRRGDVYLVETWSSGRGAWALAASGVNAQAAISTAWSIHDGVSLLLVGSSDGIATSTADIIVALPFASRTGLSIAFQSDSGVRRVVLQLLYYNGSTQTN